MQSEKPTLTLMLSDLDGNTVSVCTHGGLVPCNGASGLAPALRFGKDLSHNTLLLTVEFNAAAGPCPGLQIQVHADPHLLADGALDKAVVEPLPAGWSVRNPLPRDSYTGAAVLVFSHDGTAARAAQAGKASARGVTFRVTFKISNLESAQGAWSAACFTVVTLNAPGGLGRAGLDLTVRTTGLPAGPLQVAWAPGCTGLLVLGRDPARPARNRLQVLLSNGHSTRPLIDRLACKKGDPPKVTFHFTYAKSTPGYGALCTVARIESSPPQVALLEALEGTHAGVSVAGQSDSLYWALPLKTDTVTLLDSGSLTVVFDNVASDLPLDATGRPDASALVVRWQDIPGLADGEVALPLSKEYQVLIQDLECDPPLGTALDYGQAVTVSWTTLGAAASQLTGGAVGSRHTDDGRDKPNEQKAWPRPGAQTLQVVAYQHAQDILPTAVSPALVFDFGPPAILFFNSSFSVQADGLGLDLSWTAKNTDYCCYLTDQPNRPAGHTTAMLTPCVEAHRILPTRDQPLAASYTLWAVAGGGYDARTETTPRPKFGDTLAGGILFHFEEGGAHGLVLADQLLGNGTWQAAMATCAASTRGGYSDWRLPTSEEFSLIHSNLFLLGLGGFTSVQNHLGALSTGLTYWSSTPGKEAGAHVMRYLPGNYSLSQGDISPYTFCAVRRF